VAPTGWVFLKFHLAGCYENLSRKFMFGYILTKVQAFPFVTVSFTDVTMVAFDSNQ
jgi:hypothetical protein